MSEPAQALFPHYKRQPHVTDRAATLLWLACKAYEMAGHRYRLQCVHRLQCDLCPNRAAENLALPMKDIPFAATAKRFSIHYLQIGTNTKFSKEIKILCPWCARKAKSGNAFGPGGNPIQWLAVISRKEPTR